MVSLLTGELLEIREVSQVLSAQHNNSRKVK